MAIAPIDPVSPLRFETTAEVISIPSEWQNELCIQKYDEMLDDFKELLSVANGGKSKPDCFEYPPEIVLGRYPDGKVASKVIFNSDSCAYGTVNFSDADGFRIYIGQLSVNGVEEESEYFSFSLLGANEHNEMLYPNKWQRPELRAKTQAWLEEKLPVCTNLLQTFWEAAANPDLNSEMAKRIEGMIASPTNNQYKQLRLLV